MCLAIPAKVTRIDNGIATIEMAGVTRETSIALLADVHVGDYVLVHAGYAIQKLDEAEAQETLRMFDQIAQVLEAEDSQRRS